MNSLTPRICYEDASILVVDKPAGLLLHPTGRASTEYTLVDWLVKHVPSLNTVGDDPARPGIVQRLDRAASGLLVIAKTTAAFEALKKQFADHRVQKEYLALVHGTMPRTEGTIALSIGRATGKRGRGRFVAKPTTADGKTAVTHFVVEASNPRYTLLTVRTETGRTHQIRAHLAAYGHPIVGDTEYVSKRWKNNDAPRLFLHATRLGITHPMHGQWIEWKSALPAELSCVLEQKHLRV